MFYQEKNNTMEALFATISEKGFQGMGEAIQILMNEAMKMIKQQFFCKFTFHLLYITRSYLNKQHQ